MTLRISLLKGSRPRAVLKLEGSVSGDWVGLLETECSDLLRAWGALSLDLTRVVFIDRAGVEAFGRLSRAGVEVRGCPGPVASVLEGEGVKVMQDFDQHDDESL